jgi:hypothetical protein
MKIFLVEKAGKVYEYPGKKLTNFSSVYEAAKNIWSNKSRLQYKLDGLIFTPVDEPYFNKGILKWKDDNTIDFYYETHGAKTKLYLAGTGANGKYGMIPFGPGNSIYEDQDVSSDIRKGTIDKVSGPPKGVAEFRFDDTFKMIKFRPDKEFPNGVAASNQAWEAIRNPLTIEELGQGPIDFNNNSNKKFDVIRLESIEKYFESKNISGKIVHEPFKNFCHNRNVALQSCVGLSDYVLLLDADMILDLKTFDKKILNNADNFYLIQGNASFYYQNMRIVKNNGCYKYVGVTHEYIDTPQNTNTISIDKEIIFIKDNDSSKILTVW